MWIFHTLIAWKKPYIYLRKLESENITDEQSVCVWIFKLRIRRLSKFFSKEAVCSNKIESSALETKLNILESKICFREDLEYFQCKEKLDKLYQEKINSAIIRSRCDWYEFGKKLSKFFLNLEKNRNKNHQNQIIAILYSEKELMKNL